MTRESARVPGYVVLAALFCGALGLQTAIARQENKATGKPATCGAADSTEVARHLDLGRQMFDFGDLDGAEGEYREALQLNPKSAEAYNGLGLVSLARNNLDNATGEFRKALQLKPGFAQPHCNLGLILGRKKDYDGAISEFQAALRLNQRLIPAYDDLGEILLSTGEPYGAVQQLRQAVQMNPGMALIHAYYGMALVQTGSLAAGIDQIEEAIRLKPQLDAAHIFLAYSFCVEHRPKEGLAEARQALSIRDSASAHVALAYALDGLADYDGATSELNKAISMEPNFAAAYWALGVVLVQEHKERAALEEFQKACQLIPGHSRPCIAYRALSLKLEGEEQ